MGEGLKGMSLAKAGLKRKLMVSFALMSITPILACCCLLLYYIQPQGASMWVWMVSVVILLVLLISLFGFYLMKDVIVKVIRLAIAVEKLSTCDEIKDIDISGEDEIGVLEASINRLIRRLHEKK
ncbi:MAG: hypothetical protein P9M00_08520 [Candidatus Tritonobacter lacicola]|nr:hypothetical protein [Candidatus Tritonobacter lacicola]